MKNYGKSNSILESLKHNKDIKEGAMKEKFIDLVNRLSDAPKGAKASGGGYGPFTKTGNNSWKNDKTGRLMNDESLASHIGQFEDFDIKEGADSSNDDKKDGPVELAWIEFNKKGEQVSKTKTLKNQKELEKFVEKLQDNDNLYRILGTR